MLGHTFSTFYKSFYGNIGRQNKMQQKQQQSRKTKKNHKSCLDPTLSNTIVLQTVIPAVTVLELHLIHVYGFFCDFNVIVIVDFAKFYCNAFIIAKP